MPPTLHFFIPLKITKLPFIVTLSATTYQTKQYNYIQQVNNIKFVSFLETNNLFLRIHILILYFLHCFCILITKYNIFLNENFLFILLFLLSLLVLKRVLYIMYK